MKTCTTLIIATTVAICSQATVITVSNNQNSPGQYTDLASAISAASNGDTIYVHGSQTNYGNVTIDKQLTLIGTGHNPDKDFPFVSQLSSVYLDSIPFGNSASGSKIIGFDITSSLTNSGGDVINNIEVKRNRINYLYVRGSNWLIENNVIDFNLYINNNANVVIDNNLIDGIIYNSNQSSVVIINNTFHGDGGATRYSISNIDFAVITNNIMLGRHPNNTNVDNCTFNNNITYQTSADTIPFGTNTGAGNFVGIDPLLVTISGTSFSYTNNYDLQGGSPCINAGTDGNDIGAYGGGAPFPDMTGAPRIPQIKQFTINNPVIQQNDSLSIYFKAKKQD